MTGLVFASRHWDRSLDRHQTIKSIAEHAGRADFVGVAPTRPSAATAQVSRQTRARTAQRRTARIASDQGSDGSAVAAALFRGIEDCGVAAAADRPYGPARLHRPQPAAPSTGVRGSRSTVSTGPLRMRAELSASAYPKQRHPHRPEHPPRGSRPRPGCRCPRGLRRSRGLAISPHGLSTGASASTSGAARRPRLALADFTTAMASVK